MPRPARATPAISTPSSSESLKFRDDLQSEGLFLRLNIIDRLRLIERQDLDPDDKHDGAFFQRQRRCHFACHAEKGFFSNPAGGRFVIEPPICVLAAANPRFVKSVTVAFF
jgi:hypothetical protein